jgi:hypothetical protein
LPRQHPGYLKRQRVITVDPDADVLSVSDELAERDPALAQLAAAAVSSLAPAGPELRRRPVERVFRGTVRDTQRMAVARDNRDFVEVMARRA